MKAAEADSASGSVTTRTSVGGSVGVSGVWIYQGQAFQVILARWKSQVGGRWEKERVCGGWESNVC